MAEVNPSRDRFPGLGKTGVGSAGKTRKREEGRALANSMYDEQLAGPNTPRRHQGTEGLPGRGAISPSSSSASQISCGRSLHQRISMTTTLKRSIPKAAEMGITVACEP